MNMANRSPSRPSMMLSQHAADINPGSNQTPLGKIVVKLMNHRVMEVKPADLKKLSADDANFIDRYLKNPKRTLLISRYAWATYAQAAANAQQETTK